MPLWYSGALEEHMAVRTAAGVFDISHMGRFRVEGAGAAALIAAAFSRDPSRLAPGESHYALCCNESGGIIEDLLVYRLANESFLVICNAANAETVGAALAAASDRLSHGQATPHAPAFKLGSIPDASTSSPAPISPSPFTERGLGGEVLDIQRQTVLLAIQGPAAVDRIARLLGPEFLDVKRHACIEFERAGHAYFAGRGGYTGEDGFEVMTDAEAGADLWDRLLNSDPHPLIHSASAGSSCLPCGLAARDSLRLEAALPLHGHDIDETTSPWEAGLGWAIELDHDFPGRGALDASKPNATRRLACLISDGQGIFRSHQDVYDGHKVVASLTSGGFSPMLKTSIAMAYLPRDLAPEGTALEVDLRGRRVPCHVVKRPFYTSPDLASKREH
jgi:aminomethyltransferase